jgi:hypothetical protein
MIADDIAERIAAALEQLAVEARTANLLAAGGNPTIPDEQQAASREAAVQRLWSLNPPEPLIPPVTKGSKK